MKRDIKLQYEKYILVVPIVCAVVQPIDFIRIYKYRGRSFSIHLPYTYIQLILSIPYTFLYAFHMCCMPYTYAPYICPTYSICHIHNALYVCPIRMPYIYLSEFCAVVQPMDFIRINKSTGRFFLYI